MKMDMDMDVDLNMDMEHGDLEFQMSDIGCW
jgi:hypothetical protein